MPDEDDDDDDVVVKLLEATLNRSTDNFKHDHDPHNLLPTDDVIDEDEEIVDVRLTMQSLLINDNDSFSDDDEDKKSVGSERSSKKNVKFASGAKFVTALSISSNGVPLDSLEPNRPDCDSVSLSTIFVFLFLFNV
jgi:hypothetical protein